MNNTTTQPQKIKINIYAKEKKEKKKKEVQHRFVKRIQKSFPKYLFYLDCLFQLRTTKNEKF